MPANVTTAAPAFRIVGDDTDPTDSAIGVLVRLLLAVADGESHTPNHDTPAAAAPVARVFQSAAFVMKE